MENKKKKLNKFINKVLDEGYRVIVYTVTDKVSDSNSYMKLMGEQFTGIDSDVTDIVVQVQEIYEPENVDGVLYSTGFSLLATIAMVEEEGFKLEQESHELGRSLRFVPLEDAITALFS